MKIKNLNLFTNNLEEQKKFYTSVLGLKLISEDSESFTLSIGSTNLIFTQSKEILNYHFAINIPSNKIIDAYEWLKKRVKIQGFNGNEIVNFSDWNAEAIYFHDAGKNIVEFIARKKLNIISEVNFSEEGLLCISEIGTPTNNVRKIYKELNTKYGLEKYDCEDDVFCAIGDEHGLFIVIDKTKKKWIPNMDDAGANPYKISIEVDEGIIYELKYENEKLSLDKKNIFN